jgi:4-diphosphocytidyl-2-C-methyl-D-erythritol kinase
MNSWTIPHPVTLFAPAKVNLGLEIVRRRSDGYHEVVTLMESISIFDRIELRPADISSLRSSADISPDDDLITRSLQAIEDWTGRNICLDVTAGKSIPISAGLGGGSSDAGTLIGAIGTLLGISEHGQHQIAASLGSDVPFFLDSGMALATGTGTDLTPVRQRGRRWYLILVPDLDIPGKTARLYGELDSSDFSDGSQTRELSQTAMIEPAHLLNSFHRPLMEYEPVREAIAALGRAGCGHAIPSGAGPSVFTMFDSFPALNTAVRAFRCPKDIQMFTATSVRSGVNRQRIERLCSKK